METPTIHRSIKMNFQECAERSSAIFQVETAASKIIGSDLTILKVNIP